MMMCSTCVLAFLCPLEMPTWKSTLTVIFIILNPNLKSTKRNTTHTWLTCVSALVVRYGTVRRARAEDKTKRRKTNNEIWNLLFLGVTKTKVSERVTRQKFGKNETNKTENLTKKNKTKEIKTNFLIFTLPCFCRCRPPCISCYNPLQSCLIVVHTCLRATRQTFGKNETNKTRKFNTKKNKTKKEIKTNFLIFPLPCFCRCRPPCIPCCNPRQPCLIVVRSFCLCPLPIQTSWFKISVPPPGYKIKVNTNFPYRP